MLQQTTGQQIVMSNSLQDQREMSIVKFETNYCKIS